MTQTQEEAGTLATRRGEEGGEESGELGGEKEGIGVGGALGHLGDETSGVKSRGLLQGHVVPAAGSAAGRNSTTKSRTLYPSSFDWLVFACPGRLVLELNPTLRFSAGCGWL